MGSTAANELHITQIGGEFLITFEDRKTTTLPKWRLEDTKHPARGDRTRGYRPPNNNPTESVRWRGSLPFGPVHHTPGRTNNTASANHHQSAAGTGKHPPLQNSYLYDHWQLRYRGIPIPTSGPSCSHNNRTRSNPFKNDGTESGRRGISLAFAPSRRTPGSSTLSKRTDRSNSRPDHQTPVNQTYEDTTTNNRSSTASDYPVDLAQQTGIGTPPRDSHRYDLWQLAYRGIPIPTCGPAHPRGPTRITPLNGYTTATSSSPPGPGLCPQNKNARWKDDLTFAPIHRTPESTPTHTDTQSKHKGTPAPNNEQRTITPLSRYGSLNQGARWKDGLAFAPIHRTPRSAPTLTDTQSEHPETPTSGIPPAPKVRSQNKDVRWKVGSAFAPIHRTPGSAPSLTDNYNCRTALSPSPPALGYHAQNEDVRWKDGSVFAPVHQTPGSTPSHIDTRVLHQIPSQTCNISPTRSTDRKHNPTPIPQHPTQPVSDPAPIDTSSNHTVLVPHSPAGNSTASSISGEIPRHKIHALQWNVNGLRSRYNELQLLVNENPPDVLALQETIIGQRFQPNNWLSGKYQWYTQHKSRGTALAVANNIAHQRVKINTTLPAVAVKLEGTLTYTVISIYIPCGPVPNLDKQLIQLFKQLEPPFLLLGDLNAHHPAWGSPQADTKGKDIINAITEIDLVVLNNGSSTWTRPGHRRESAIDVSLCSPNLLTEFGWSIGDDLRGSDHYPIFIHGHTTPIPTTRRPKWLYDQADWNNYGDHIMATLPTDTCSYDQLTASILKAAKASIPKSKPNPGKKAVPWWSDEVRTAIKLRRKTLRKLRKSDHNDPDYQLLLANFQKARSRAKKVVNEAKKATWEEFLRGIGPQSSISETWRRVNCLSGKRRSQGLTLTIDGRPTTEQSTIAEQLASYFEDLSSDSNYTEEFLKAKQLAESSPITLNPSNQDEYNTGFTIEELNWATRLSRGKSDGPDGIGYQHIRNLPLDAQITLLGWYNNIWQTGNIPAEWGLGTIIPIPKPNRKGSSPEDFRPITLTSCMSKVFEKMVNRRLTHLLESANFLDHRQFAFRRGRGTGTYFACLNEELRHLDDKKIHADFAILDIEKAYNRVYKRGILDQLIAWGIRGNLLRFLANFILQTRHFQVGVGNHLSSPRVQKNGVPQGSVLAVTLFLIAMNSVFTHIPEGIKVYIYADDIVLMAIGGRRHINRRKLQEGIDNINNWANSVGFSIAAEKCEILHVCKLRHHGRSKVVRLNESPIPDVRTARILGVVFDRKLTFNEHLRKLKSGAQSTLNLLKTISARHPGNCRRTLINVGKSLLLSKMLYGIEITNRSLPTVLNILQPTFNQIIRIASGLLPSSPIDVMLTEAGELPFRLYAALALAKAAIRFEESTSGRLNLLMEVASRVVSETTGTEIPRIRKLHWTAASNWARNNIRVDWSIKKQTAKGPNPKVATAIFNNLVNDKYKHHTIAYTDGSVAAGRTGIGVHIAPRGNYHYRLPDNLSIFSAEAAAICLALHKSKHRQPSVVFTDSASVLEALAKGKSRHPFIQAIESMAGSSISFCWIPGHSGIPGNNKADQLASKGRQGRLWDTKTPGPDAIRYIKESIRQSWQNHWRNNTSVLQLVKPITERWTDRDNKAEQRALSRCRVGHTRVTHRHYLTGGPRTECDTCHCTLDVQHILTSCSKYYLARQTCGISPNIDTTLSNRPEEEDKLLKFLSDTGLLGEI